MKGVLSLSGLASAVPEEGQRGEVALGRPSTVWTASPWRNLAAPSTCPVELRARIRRCRMPGLPGCCCRR